MQNRVSHASIFSGPRGTGKTSMAKIMGKALNCLDLKEGEPCNKCSNCISINEGSFLDYFEIDAASNRGIDEIRDMRERVKFAPSQGRSKVYVIDEVHMLTNEAFNALLKTLEEPPAHVFFILATTEIHRIPLTIISRCQRFDFKQISEETIKTRLQEIIEAEGLSVEDAALDLIAKKAEGGLRDAISILDQGVSASLEGHLSLAAAEDLLGTLNEDQLANLFTALFEEDMTGLMASLDAFQNAGKDIKQIVKDMADYLREIILHKLSKNQANENIKKLAAMKEDLYLVDLLKDLIEAEQKMYFFSRPRIILEALLLARPQARPAQEKAQLVKKISDQPQAKKDPAPVEPRVEVKTQPEPARPARDFPAQPQARPQRPQASSGHVDWEEILEEVKREKIMLHACLIEASFDLKGDQAYISFPENRKFHQERTSQPENTEVLEKIIEKKYNIKVRVHSIFEGGQAEEVDSLESQAKPTKKDEEETDALAEALKIFDAEIVEIKE